MRVLAVLGATALAVVTAAVATQETAFRPNSLVAMNDRTVESGVIAHDFEEELTQTAFRYDPTEGNELLSSVWVANNVLGAYDDGDDEEEADPTPQCSTGPIDVLFLVSSCFTGAEIKSILSPIDCAMTDGTMEFYHNGQPIAVRPTFGIYYYDCHTPRVVGTFKNLEQVYAPTHKDVFVAVSKGKENSFLKIFSVTGIKVAYSLQIRTCTNKKCRVGQDDLVIASPNNFNDVILDIRDAVFCEESPSPPTLYVDEQQRQQCACGCPAPFSLIANVCKCPGDLVPRDDACKCPVGQVPDGANQCKNPPATTTPPTLPVVTQPVETQPVETQPVETQPVETQPVETQPVETQPVETQPVETQPVETQPVETQPVETQPVETQPVETQPVETQPVETQPVETQPVETQPVETQPVETQPVETQPVETQPVETQPVETQPVETQPVETQPVETQPVETQPVETQPVETQPVETQPVETQPVETQPVETQPVETQPVETQPVETQPVETQPVETQPVETQPVETQPVETQPVETQPVETQPVETQPVETQPVETQPVETQPVETQPVETQPVETQPVETQPVETQPVETQPVETQPVETQPVETQPVETQPVETQPVETQPVETQPVETQPVETQPVETQPVETQPVETQPVETQPVETQPVETQPVETQPVETQPVETQPVETQPVETQPVETQPVETQPVETQPVETQPVETQPVETQPVDTQPVDTQPVDTQPVDTQPVDTQPVDTQPVDTQPVDTTPPVVCDGGMEPQSDGSCHCPPDKEVGYDGDCVDKCYWQPGNAGYNCQWSSQDDTPLTLNGDCEVDAPVASDVYINDGRINEYDSNFRPQDPLIELGSTPRGTSDSSTYQTTWRSYALTPSLLEDSVTFSSFGVYDLSMVTTNYRKRATCSGCIAIVDDYQPTAIETCQTAGSVVVDYSSDSLDTTIKAEAAFKSFYADANVLDNGAVDEATGANVRDDEQTAQVQDFFATEYSDIEFETECFGSSFTTDLISKMTNIFDPNDLLECKRCCHKTTTLGGTYHDYSCDASTAELKRFDDRDEDSCSFDRCITMKAPGLVDASATSITDAANTKSKKIVDGLPDPVQLDGSTIHRSIPCTTHDASNPACAFRAQLDALFKPSASWNEDLDIPDDYVVDEYVRWYYYVGVGGVQEWNSEDVLVFTESSTDVVLRAYTQCGLVAEFEFHVVLYPHSSHDACASFTTKWALSAPSQHDVTPINPSDKPASCAYPGSDFAVATFTYDIDDILTHTASHVQGTYTDVKCYATVASAGHLDDVSEVELPLSSWTPGTKINLAEQLALELVHEPTTALDTDVRVRCDFTFQHYDATTTVTEPCTHEFTITECDEPEIEQRGDEVCTEGKCLDPVGAPGPYEACDGVVLTTTSVSDEAKTAIKSVDDTCCAACSTTLHCNALPEASGIKRCEPKASGFTMVALASSIQNGDFNAGAMAAVGVSAMVAIIAVVIVKRRAAANRLKIDDDVYYPLLE